MAIYDFFLSRNGAPVTRETYAGHPGRLFYDDATGEIRLGDGATPGGFPIPITIATAATAGSVKPSSSFSINPTDGTLGLLTATETRIGGVRLGPGVTTNQQGQIIIDSEGLDFSFGDFAAIVGTYSDSTEYALLSSIKDNEDIVIASNGDGTIKLVGAFEVYRTNGTVTGSLEDEEPYFKIKEDGQVRILVPAEDMLEGGIEIIGSLTGTYVPPGIVGTMLHLTGNPDVPTRVYHDTLGDYSSYVFRRYNGSVASPGQVLANQDIGRINWTAATDSGMGNVATAQIRVTALENQTTTAQGSKITFTATPAGQPAANRVNVLDITAEGLLPAIDDTFDLGSVDRRWQSLYLGPGTIIIEDTVTGDDVSITVTNGVLQIDGANQLQVGQLKFVDNTIQSTTPDTAIAIGQLADTADLVLNRNVVLGTGKSITGTISTATNLAAASNILAGTVTIDPTVVDRNTASVQTFTLTGLTINHKIVITSATAFGYGLFISAAWASAADTLSVEIQNFRGNQDVDLPAKTIQYFAWV
jgi:hypothetical protein